MTAIAAIEISAPRLSSITTEDIGAFRPARKAEGLSAVTVNHDLKLLRKMLNWGIRRGYLQRTPFKVGTESAIALQRGDSSRLAVRERG